MKIKNIAAICKSRKTIVLYDERDGGTQWISNGSAVYPLYGLPELDEETVLTVLDIPEKDRGKFIVRRTGLPERYCFDDDDIAERMLPRPLVTIGYGGQVLYPARTRKGLLFIDPEYVRPIEDRDPELYERENETGETYIAVKTGMMLQAVILPEGVDEKDLAERLETLCQELWKTVDRKEKEQETEQIEIDPETGEIIGQ